MPTSTQSLKKLASKHSLKNKRILITCGPTWAAIDDMRVISNKSTGSLGQLLAKELSQKGSQITLLEGPVKHPLKGDKITIKRFSFYDEFVMLLNRMLKHKFDVVIHAAAVSDYKVKNPARIKIRSGLKKLKLELIPTKKVINSIKRQQPKCLLVGFKLESTLSAPRIKTSTQKLFREAKCDLVVANYFHRKAYKGFVVSPEGRILSKSNSRQAIVRNLILAIQGAL